MASISNLMETPTGRRYWLIRVRMGRNKSPLKTRFYWPDGKNGNPVSETTALRQLDKFASEFERQCKAGEILSREDKKEQAAAEQAERAKLKTLRQYTESIFMPTKELSIAENTRLSYWSNLNEHILPFLGNETMTEISSAMISNRLLEFQKTHSYGSAIKLYNLFNGIFKMAFMDDTVAINPMHKVSRPKQRKDDKAISEADKALFEDELLYVLDCVQNEPLKWQVFIYLAADLGARRGEICGLQWSDIDLKNGLVSIRRNLQYSKDKKVDPEDKSVIYDGVYEVTPKGGRFRTVDIGDDTIKLLEQYKAELTKPDEIIDFKEAAKQGGKQQKKPLPKWLFTIEGADLPMHPQSPTRYFTQFGKRYNLPGFHPHLLRHTSATLSLTNGGDYKSVADRLGHKDASILLKVYAHANDDSIRAAGQAARDALKRKKEEQKKKETAAGN